MKEIYSTNNPLIKEIRKLSMHKYRNQTQSYLIEGDHLVEEAVKSSAPILQIVATFSWLEKGIPSIKDFEEQIVAVTEEVMKSLTELPSPQGIAAVIKLEQDPLPNKISGPVLLLDSIQDPGNVGTMIRTADAAGFFCVVLGAGCADIYNSKVMRAMQGSNFHIPIYSENLLKVIADLKSNEIPVYGTELALSAVDYRLIHSTKVFGLVMGNEGQGVAPEILAETTSNLYIAISGQAESLNVAIAAGILMFHLKS